MARARRGVAAGGDGVEVNPRSPSVAGEVAERGRGERVWLRGDEEPRLGERAFGEIGFWRAAAVELRRGVRGSSGFREEPELDWCLALTMDLI